MKFNVVRCYGLAFIVVLGFISYMSFTTPLPTRRPDEQTILHSQVPGAADPDGNPAAAAYVRREEALAYLRIPRFGKDWLWTVLQGARIGIIDHGPGHFIKTALPGEIGNSSYAAHRASHGDPFIDFEELEIGDEIVVSQTDAEWTYEVTTTPQIISDDSSWVLDTFAEGRWMTLVTCWPKYGSEKRIYVRAKMVDNS